MQADAEHQEDDADLGKLRRKVLVGDETRRMRADKDAGDQVTDKRRQAEAIGDGAEDERKDEAPDDGRNQRRIVRHTLSPLAPASCLSKNRVPFWADAVEIS